VVLREVTAGLGLKRRRCPNTLGNAASVLPSRRAMLDDGVPGARSGHVLRLARQQLLRPDEVAARQGLLRLGLLPLPLLQLPVAQISVQVGTL